MKCTIPEISWHNREPVLSVDIHPISNEFYRLATGGGDCHVLIWQMIIARNGAVKQELVSDLTRHQKAVNVVRWSGDGQFLASADDDANIIIWHLKTDNIPLLDCEGNDKEIWILHKVLRGHKEDIYDLCWSADGSKLITGSIDNTAIIWDFSKGKISQILTDHKGFVQGVSWDPKGQYLATISTDRICRIFDNTGKQVKARIQKGKLPVSENHYLYDKEIKYFHDDTFKSFFRRLQFTPDGTLLVAPSGKVEIEDSKKILNATFVFPVDSWTGPCAILPCPKQCSTVVRCCPILYELHEDGPEAYINLPYRMIIAVGTDHDVILYDTQQMAPFARFRDIHYTRLTDLTWSHDGLLLIASSTDGFCALITFEPDELGVPYVKEESEGEENVLDISGCEELEKDETPVVENKEIKKKEVNEIVKPKRPNLLEQWAIRTPKKTKLDTASSENRNPNTPVDETQESVDKLEVIEILDDDSQEQTPKKRKLESSTSVNGTVVTSSPNDKLLKDKLPCSEVIELLDDNDDSIKPKQGCSVSDSDNVRTPSKEINNPLNRLTPKRITPKQVSRRRPRDTDTTNEKPMEQAVINNTNTINKLIPRRITPILVKTETDPSKTESKYKEPEIKLSTTVSKREINGEVKKTPKRIKPTPVKTDDITKYVKPLK